MMSKLIKATKEYFDEALKEFMSFLSEGKFTDGEISYSKSFGNIERRAKLSFTHTAWDKMQALVKNFNKEVAWHGIAKRGNDTSKDEYIISDIIVYPQEVTGATVTTDQNEYQTWLMAHDDDVFNNIRMQGHSHVNMGVTPSSVDTTLYDNFLKQLTDDMFYIFLIWNKKGDKTIKIYDLGKNILFTEKDVDVEILESTDGFYDFSNITPDEVKAMREFLVKYRELNFIEASKKLVKDKVIKTTTYYGNGYNSYNGHHPSSFNGGISKTTSTAKQTTATTFSKPSVVASPVNEASSKKKKGKRKGKKSSYDKRLELYGYDVDDYTDPFYSRGY